MIKALRLYHPGILVEFDEHNLWEVTFITFSKMLLGR
jgi:hypothetical protein